MNTSPYNEAEYKACREAVLRQAKIHVPSRERLLKVFPSLDQYDYHFKLSLDFAMDIVEDLFCTDPYLMLDHIQAALTMNVLQQFDLNFTLAMDLGDQLIRPWIRNAGLHCLIMNKYMFVSPRFTEDQLADEVIRTREKNMKARGGESRT